MELNTILIVSNSDDAHAMFVEKRLKERFIKFTRLNSDTFANTQFSWRVNDFSRNIGMYHDDVRTVWYRKPYFPSIDSNDLSKSFIDQEKRGLFTEILQQYSDLRWINPLENAAKAALKLHQLEIARGVGFTIPDSLITNDVCELEDFAAKHNHRIVAKPLHTQVIGNDDNARVVGTRILPRQYYELAVAGGFCYVQEQIVILNELKIVIFGSQMYAFQLTSKKPYEDLKRLRLSDMEYDHFHIEKDLYNMTRNLLSLYGLEFCVMDLVINSNGEMVFLELNPNGQWLWLQFMTEKNLIDPFIDFLL